jgi:transcriptional regulator of arginine metabolism
MNEIRARRQRALRQLLRDHLLGSQEEVLERLRASGFDLTQATVSRDLEQLGAIKARRDGRVAYALPDDLRGAMTSERRYRALFSEWVRSAEAVGQLIVVRTPPGSAHLVGVAIDEARRPEIAGTICGDDTIFVAVREIAQAPGLVRWLTGADEVSA